MVEENARAAEHIVGFAVFLDNPEAVELGHGIGAVGMEGGLLVLGHFFHLAVEFRGRCLIDAASVSQTQLAHGFEHTQNASSIDISRKLR